MHIPSYQKPAVTVTNVQSYLAARKPLDMATGHFIGGKYLILLDGSFITYDEYNAKLKQVEKILRPANYKGKNKDERSHMNLGIQGN